MKPFLKDLAETFLRTYGHTLSDFCFVLPNKRSGTFLQNYFCEAFKSAGATMHDVLVMPRIMTITDFVSSLAGLVVDSRIDMLFSLFRLYRIKEGADQDFDRFRSWGEMALSDFNDVDMFCVDPDRLFRNLSDLKEIETDFLTEEQCEVVETYFPNYSHRRRSDSFWTHFNAKSPTGTRYLRLWESMNTLYHELDADLEARGLCSSGGAYRRALARIESQGRDALPYAQVVCVGFNALTTVEFRIFRALQKLRVDLGGERVSLGDFYWDAVGDVLNGDSSAAHFVVRDKKNFPSKLKLRESSAGNGFPQRTVAVACPGNTIQAKVVSGILREVMASDPEAVVRAGGTVVAMPDEGLFFPMLYSLPSELEEVNITMGYPLKVTATYSWMRLLRTLQAHSRPERGEIQFIRAELMPLLSHPLTRVLLGSKYCQWLAAGIGERKNFMVGTNEIQSIISAARFSGDEREDMLRRIEEMSREWGEEALNLIFTPFSEFPDTSSLCDHLLRLLALMADTLAANGEKEDTATLHASLERDNLHTYMDAVRRFRDAVNLHGVGMRHGSMFALLNSLLASETISLSGEPLCGVQIMGMLETRSLDFDNVIITSMNERVFPRRLRNRSFIPNSLRIDYGMATTRFQESIFAYYFYRMISRAKNVWLLYDSRSAGLRSGDPSRYIYQLRYLYPHLSHIENQTRRLSVATPVSRPVEGAKTPEVMRRLSRYLEEGSGKTLSASALKTYMSCPMQFYFKYVQELYVREEEIEAMTPAQQGTVFHDTMNELYDSFIPSGGAGVQLTASMLRSLLAPDENGESPAGRKLRDMILREYLHTENTDVTLTGYAELYFDPLYRYVKDTIEADILAAPFTYLGGEKKEIQRYPLHDGSSRMVNMKFIIDRIDRVGDRTRLVDYKTGADKTDFSKVSDLFNDCHAVFQLMLYASLYDLKTGNTEPLQLCLAKPALLAKNGFSFDLRYAGEIFRDHLQIKAEFEAGLDAMLCELFDPEVPFSQCKSRGSVFGTCRYCDYSALCNMKKEP